MPVRRPPAGTPHPNNENSENSETGETMFLSD
jgi:hypothetical protein